MKKLFITIIIVMLGVMNARAEKLARVLKGQVEASNAAGLRVIISESDGSILDMTDTSDNGSYQLDLTIMDVPSQNNVKKLVVMVKDKKGVRKRIVAGDYLNSFDDTVLLRPILLN